MLNWRCSRKDFDLLCKIAERAERMNRKHGAPLLYRKGNFLMDLNAVHSNGTPLRLSSLLTAPEFDFAHDIYGIVANLDRETGKLGDLFSPRYSMPRIVEEA